MDFNERFSLITELSSIIVKHFPNIELSKGTIADEAETGIIKSGFIIPNAKNSMIRNTKFSYQGKNKFIHYTSADAVVSIFKERSIRMYSLDTMNDPFELKTILENRNIGEEFIKTYKQNIWAFSFCDFKVEEHSSSLHLWREYSDYGKGCAIVFEIEPGINISYEKHIISRINYEDFNDCEATFLDEIDAFINKHGLTIMNLNDLIAEFSPLIKEKIFSYEKELRVLYRPNSLSNSKPIVFMDREKLNEKLLYPAFKKNKLTSYSVLSIDREKEKVKVQKLVEERITQMRKIKDSKPNRSKIFNEINGRVPKIRILQILAGPEFPKKVICDFEKVLNSYYQEYSSEVIKVERSKIARYFD